MTERKETRWPESAELEQFRELQQLAYRCAEYVARELKPGITELETARRMKRWLLDHGVDGWFHQPFAWFGDRTVFNGFRGFSFEFFPTRRRLEEGMPFILDCAPVKNGIVADIGYTGCIGRNPILDRLMKDLAEHRRLILDLVRKRHTLAEVSRAVDQLCARQGVEPRHKAYPFSVLAHRVEKLKGPRFNINIGRFGVRSVAELVRESIAGRWQGWSPLWSSGRRSDHPPTPGLWAVEPHLGFRGVGAKFEELLVITENDAWWLDDNLPHVRRWRKSTWAARHKPATA